MEKFILARSIKQIKVPPIGAVEHAVFVAGDHCENRGARYRKSHQNNKIWEGLVASDSVAEQK